MNRVDQLLRTILNCTVDIRSRRIPNPPISIVAKDYMKEDHRLSMIDIFVNHSSHCLDPVE